MHGSYWKQPGTPEIQAQNSHLHLRLDDGVPQFWCAPTQILEVAATAPECCALFSIATDLRILEFPKLASAGNQIQGFSEVNEKPCDSSTDKVSTLQTCGSDGGR